MDRSQRERRIGYISIAAALVVVCVFWLLKLHQEQPQIDASEARIKAKLETIHQPATAQRVQITTYHQPRLLLASGIYMTREDCEHVRTHYRTELPRNGYTFTRAEGPESGANSLIFSNADYQATLTCNDSKEASIPVMYTLTLQKMNP